MYSFYGGHPGSSINIVAYYNDLTAIQNAFNSNNTIRYGQCAVIINPSDNLNNGKIYQKMYNNNALLIGQFSATLKANYITKAVVTEQNHLLIKYSDTDHQGDITYNNENGWTDLGDISVNITLNMGQIYPNLNWCGVGTINEIGVIKFTLPLSRPIHNEASLITTSAGSLTVKNKEHVTIIDAFSLGLDNSNKIIINENVLGLEFIVDSSQILNDISGNEIVDITISNLTLRIN